MSNVTSLRSGPDAPLSRRKWCAIVGKLVSPSYPDDTALALADMLPALRSLPDALFTEDTAVAVAACDRKQPIPNFKEIRDALNRYRTTFVHEPNRLAIDSHRSGGRTPPDEAEKAAVRFTVAGFMAELAARAVDQAQPPPLADVTLKGEALRRSRQARGLIVPVVADPEPSDADSEPDNSSEAPPC